MDWSRIRHFDRQEWATDPDRVDPELVLALDRVRERAGRAITIHEAFAVAGHAPASLHDQGRAVDFHFAPGLSPEKELACLLAEPLLLGLGYYPAWRPRPGWHADLGKKQRFWIGRGAGLVVVDGPAAFRRVLAGADALAQGVPTPDLPTHDALAPDVPVPEVSTAAAPTRDGPAHMATTVTIPALDDPAPEAPTSKTPAPTAAGPAVEAVTTVEAVAVRAAAGPGSEPTRRRSVTTVEAVAAHAADIDRAATESGLPPKLVAAVAAVESGGNTFAMRYEPSFDRAFDRQPGGFLPPGCSEATEEVGRAMSWGLMQVLGETARIFGFRGSFPELCQPPRGLRHGCLFLARLRDRYLADGWEVVLRAYNAGPGGRHDVKNRYPDKVLAVLGGRWPS